MVYHQGRNSAAGSKLIGTSFDGQVTLLAERLANMIRNMLLVLVCALWGCASVRTYESLRQPIGVRLSAEIGAPLFHMDRSSDLPNAFGKADLFGGKVDGGYVELVFAGVAQTGGIIFRVTDLGTRSSETTMSRYGATQAQATTTTYGNVSTTDVTVREPPRGSTVPLPPNTTEFLYDTRSEPLVIRGIEVTILGLSPYRCDYALRDLRQR
ncbi:MAG TPA: hypothetical protein VJ801_17360 [Polyangia bacterium]|nr:hypothetical protein [Polyangia bacterium]